MWKALGQQELALIISQKRERSLEPGEILFNQGDPSDGLFLIKDGLIGERRVDAEGHSVLVRLRHPGSAIGYQEVLSNSPHRNSAEVLRPSQICFVGRTVLRKMLATSPSLRDHFLRESLLNSEELEAELIAMKSASVRTRLLHVLMTFYAESGRYIPDEGYVVEIPIHRHELAELVGTVPETISRAIRRIHEDGNIRFDGQTVTIANINAILSEVSRKLS